MEALLMIAGYGLAIALLLLALFSDDAIPAKEAQIALIWGLESSAKVAQSGS